MAAEGAVLVVQTRTRSGPWACRSLARAGYRVVAADAGRGMQGHNRWARAVSRTPCPEEDPAGFVAAVERICRREGVAAVLPNDDERATRLLSRSLAGLSSPAFAGPTPAQYAALCDKAALEEVAVRAEVDYPRSVVIDPRGSSGTLPALPSVVKPRASEIAGAELKALVARTEDERDAAVAAVLERAPCAVVQEYVTGPQWRVHFARDGSGFVGLPVATLRMHPRDAGVSSVSMTGLDGPPGLLSAVERVVAAVDYRGVGSAQFLLVGDRLVLHDVNLRLPASVAISLRSGLDLPRLAAEIALRGSMSPSEPGGLGRAGYVWLDGEARSIVRAFLHGPRREAVRCSFDLARMILSPRVVVDPVSLHDPVHALAVALRAVT